MRIAIVLALAMALGRSLSTDIPAASILDQTNDTLVEYVYNGDRYKHVFPDVNFEFSSEVYERNEPLANGIADDFDADNDRPSRLYKVLCALSSLPRIAGWRGRNSPSIEAPRPPYSKRASTPTCSIPLKLSTS